MHAAVKLLIGLVFIGVGLYLLVPGSWLGLADKGLGTGLNLEWGDEFLVVLKGMIPPILVLIGILIVWIESEELKAPSIPEIEEELEEEEGEEEEKPKRKRGRPRKKA